MSKWRRGLVFATNETRRWSDKQIIEANALEGRIIFSNFTIDDLGRSRQRICVLNEMHQDFEFNRTLIENANEMLEALLKIAHSKKSDDGNEMDIDECRQIASRVVSLIIASSSD